jgi:hypothetical protein
MPRIRFPMATLMGLVLTLAFGMTCLRSLPLRRDAVDLLSLSAGAYGLAALLALFVARGRGRAPLLGFAGGGTMYLMLSFGPGLDPPDVPYSSEMIESLFPRIYPESYLATKAIERGVCCCGRCVDGVRERLRAGFLRDGHAICGLAAAVLAGATSWLLVYLAGKRRAITGGPACGRVV